MAPTSNKSLIYKEVPEAGYPVAGKHLVVEDRPLDLENAELHGGVLVKVFFTSFDPYLRGRMRDPKIWSYSPAFTVDTPLVSAIAGKVVRSATPQFQAGDIVAAFGGPNAEYAVIPEQFIAPSGLRKVDNPHNLPLSYFIGYLGMPGTTAYEGLYEIGKPKAGETIFISSAAGAVGQIVGQLAKAEGLTVLGSAGSQEKIDYIKSVGFDDAFNYKTEAPLEALRRLAPNGIDIYFDNVGGESLEAALEVLNVRGRIIGCGAISGYNAKPDERYGIKNTFMAIPKRLTWQGFIVDLSPPKYAAALEKLVPMFVEGKLQGKEDIYDGIEKGPEALVGIFKGQNFGKAILKIADA